MAQFRMIPPETGINNTSLQCWSTRLGWRTAPLCTAHPLHYHGRPDVSGRIQCRTAALPSHTPISSPRLTPDCQQHCYVKTQLVSDFRSFPRLKCCAIQQMNLLFCFLSLLSYGFQLNIMEAGSWFAVWAIWRRISFFVIMPRRRLKRINGRLILIQAGK